MEKRKKITVFVPEDLLLKAQKAQRCGITEAVEKGLRLLAAGDAYRTLSSLRGKARVSIDLRSLREDR